MIAPPPRGFSAYAAGAFSRTFGGEVVRFHLPYGDGVYLLVGELHMFHAGLLLHQQCEPLARLVKIVDDGRGTIANDRLERLAPTAQRAPLDHLAVSRHFECYQEARCPRP